MAADKVAVSAGTTILYTPSTSVGSPSQSEPSEDQDRTRRSCLHRQLRKTKFCMYHLQGICHFGDDCAFAHGCNQLQKMPNLHKTRLCTAFASGECNDAECTFAHSEEELRSTDVFYKKNLCMWYEKGRCRNGRQCRFAHGIEEVVDANVPGTGNRGPRAGNSTVCGAKASQKKLHNKCQPGGEGATTHGSVYSAMSDNKGTATTTPIFADVNGNSLEPMFVQTMPRLGLPSTSHANSNQLLDYQRIVAQMPLVNHAQTATWMQDTELLRRYEWQMEQLRNASAVAAAASAANDARSDMPQSVDLQADLEKLTQNIATLSLQLSRFEMQIQENVTAMPMKAAHVLVRQRGLSSSRRSLLHDLRRRRYPSASSRWRRRASGTTARRGRSTGSQPMARCMSGTRWPKSTQSSTRPQPMTTGSQ